MENSKKLIHKASKHQIVQVNTKKKVDTQSS